jgi:hypothetical protein
MTNVMTWLPSAQCDCGQPWGAHQLRCPRPKHRGVGKVIALAVAGGVALQVLFIFGVFIAAGPTRPPTIQRFSIAHPSGPVQPRIRACEEFYAWKRTRNPNLLNDAVADAHGSRVPSRFAPQFRADLTGLRDSARKNAHSPAAMSFEHAVQHHCKLLRGGTPFFRAHFRRAVAQFSRPGAAKERSASSAQPGAPSGFPGEATIMPG